MSELENQLQWEDIFLHNNGIVYFTSARAKVFGEWLISHSINFAKEIATSTCFLPDKNHEWDLKKENNDKA